MKYLNGMTMRMVWEAKTQLSSILSAAGFPDECLAPTTIQNQGPDSKLDVLTTLLTYGMCSVDWMGT
jgi:hypothetical protein